MTEVAKPAGYDAVPPEVQAAWEAAMARDRCGDYVTGRNLSSYLRLLGGLATTLDQTKKVEASDVIVDIGAGDAIAINELAALRGYADELTFWATGLTPPLPRLNGSYNRVPYIITGAEVLEGVPAAAGLLAVVSTTYSPRPDLVVAACDRMLVPGGVSKMAFLSRTSNRYFLSGAQAYEHQFRETGFDVAGSRTSDRGAYTVVAVKPGDGMQLPGAEELLTADLEAKQAMLDAHLARLPDTATA